MAGKPAPPRPKLDPRATPDYFGATANWANSPLLRKFVDQLPGVGAAAANDLGQYIPVAVPDTTTYPGADYYEIAVRQYAEKLHSDLPADPAARLRAAQPRHRRERAEHGGPGGHPLPRAAHRRATRPAGTHQVRQRAARRQRRQALPPGGHHDHRRRQRPARRRRDVPAEPRVAAPARRPDAVDQRRLAVSVGDAGRRAQPLQRPAPASPTSRTCGSTPLADRSPRARPGPPTTQARARRRCTSPTTRAPASSICTTTPSASRASASTRARRRRTSSRTPSTTSSSPPAPSPPPSCPSSSRTRPSSPAREQLRTQDPTWDLAHWGGRGALWYPHVYMPNQNAADRDNVNAKGRWDYLPWYWTGYDRTVNGPVANPLFGIRPLPTRAESRHPQPLGGAEHLLRHDARQRHRLPLRQGRAQGVPAAHPQRLRRPRRSTCSSTTRGRTTSRRRGREARPQLQTDSGDVPMLAAVGSVQRRPAGRAGRRTGARAGCQTRAPSAPP